MTTGDGIDEDQFKTLKRAVIDFGPILRGSVVRRFMPCGKKGCRCQRTPPQLHGPYYQWTRTVCGKTVTTRIKEEQAEGIRERIENRRRLDELIAEVEKLSLEMAFGVLRQLKDEDDRKGTLSRGLNTD